MKANGDVGYNAQAMTSGERGGRLRGLTRTPLSDTHKRSLWTLDEALNIFCEVTGRQDMPLQYLRAFLKVPQDEGMTVNDYAERVGVSKSVMSRHLLDIGPRARNASLGFGLVEHRARPHDFRAHEVFLTPKGRALAERLSRYLENAAQPKER